MSVTADAAVSLLIQKLGELIIRETSGGEEMIRSIEDELEWLNPAFEKIDENEVGAGQKESIRQVMVRAQDLVHTYPKTVSQSKKFSFLKKKKMILELRRVLDDITDARYRLSGFVNHQPLQEEDDECFNGVHASLRNFLFYFLLFPAGFKIPARRLIALWIAEGLIQPKKYEKESVEDIGEHYLNELIIGGVVSVVEWKSNGKVKTCELKRDDGVRERWILEAKEHKFLPNRPEDVRRLADGSRAGDVAGPSSIQILGNHSIYEHVPRYRNLISFLSFDDKQGRRERDDIGFFINQSIQAGCFEWLKVLDLERVFHPVLYDCVSISFESVIYMWEHNYTV